MRIEHVPFSSHNNDRARLVGGDEQAEVQMVEEGGQIRGMHAPQGRVYGGWRRVRRHGKTLLVAP
jgi:hypothetical protein